jgi:hypothetical protein
MAGDGDAPRRFRDALHRARAAWADADLGRQAARAGCEVRPAGIVVPFYGKEHLVSHPQGDVTSGGGPAHAAVAVLLLHYLLRADGTPLTGEWRTFRELPDGLFYWPSFTARTEAPLAAAFGGGEGSDGPGAFRAAAEALGGRQLDLADASFGFAALPRLHVATLLWQGDEDFPAEARLVFDAAAGHYLPAEDLEGVAETLTRRLLARRSV